MICIICNICITHVICIDPTDTIEEPDRVDAEGLAALHRWMPNTMTLTLPGAPVDDVTDNLAQLSGLF